RTVKFGNDLGKQCYICHRKGVVFVSHLKDNFELQNTLSFFKRLGRYWKKTNKYTQKTFKLADFLFFCMFVPSKNFTA
ncbi:MAG TPA: hypothetical protein VFM82_10090, partial [Flavobacteriaceae bacterium]|nr:hypothetical protein [Flavobacteriaceae bacterium]